jgi:rSAM/selenodomain-associated transferase 1
MPEPGSLLIQFARAPHPGRAKTRLRPVLDPIAAARFSAALTLHTCRVLCASRLAPVEVWTDDIADLPLWEQCREAGASALRQQRGDDLGARMHHALADALTRRRQVVLVGSDCPALDPGYLARALAALERSEVVLGPAQDGGYVLIGVRRLHVSLFNGVAWGSDRVLRQTNQRLAQLGWVSQELPVLRDVDRPADLGYAHEVLVARRGTA